MISPVNMCTNASLFVVGTHAIISVVISVDCWIAWVNITDWLSVMVYKSYANIRIL